MLHRSRSHWFETAPHYVPNEPQKKSVSADICIIGGGITGLSPAYYVRKLNPHASVTLLEAEVVGFGASGRNAGQLIVAFGENDFRAQLKRYGREKLSAAYAYVSQGLGMIEEIIKEHGIDCDYDQAGYLEMGMRSGGESLVNDYLNFLKLIDQGRYVESLSATQVASEFDSPYFANACFDRRGGQLNPLKLVRGLKNAAEKLGAVVYENSPVIGIQRSPDGITVQTGAGEVSCAKLVLATVVGSAATDWGSSWKTRGSRTQRDTAFCVKTKSRKLTASGRRWILHWSVIGHLQTNKAKLVARFASEFQALDSLRLAEALDRRLKIEGRSLDVFVQVNTSGEASK